MLDGVGGYLVDSVDGRAAMTTRLLRDPREAQELGAKGREHVRRHFLITRLLVQELGLLNKLR